MRVRDHTLHDFGGILGQPWDTFLLGSHNFTVTAPGSCVKWALSTPALSTAFRQHCRKMTMERGGTMDNYLCIKGQGVFFMWSQSWALWHHVLGKLISPRDCSVPEPPASCPKKLIRAPSQWFPGEIEQGLGQCPNDKWHASSFFGGVSSSFFLLPP